MSHTRPTPTHPHARGVAVVLCLGAVLGMAGASRAADVLVLLSADAPAYRQAIEGFRAASGHRIVETLDLRGDVERGRDLIEKVREHKPGLIFAVGIYALQVVHRHDPGVPVVYAMVLNPPSVIGSSNANITGASMNVPADRTLELLREIKPDLRKVGTIYDPAHTGFLVEQARSIAQAMGIELIAKPIDAPGKAIGALRSLHDAGVEAVWVLPDKTVMNPKVMEQMVLFSMRNKAPLVGISDRQAEMGAMLSLSFASSEDVGRQAGELAAKVLDGQSPRDLPYTTARQIEVVINLKVARKLGVTVPRAVLDKATSVIK